MGKQSMKSIAESCTKIALAKGAKEAGAAVSRVRDVTLDWRDGKVDRINEATRRGVQLQLYVDGRGHFRDSARLLLAELFMDAIATELAKRITRKNGQGHDAEAQHAVKLDIIRRYGTEIHRSFGNA